MAALDITLHPYLTAKQKQVLKCQSPFIILDGPAGTSKSYLALARGLHLLRKNQIEKIVIIRSAVEIRSIGYLPGDKTEKLEAYTSPYIHLINELSPKRNFKTMLNSKDIEFHSTSFLRGMTFDNSYIFLDEYQNCNAHELETAVTRVGENTHLTLCGDSAQSDLKNGESREHHKVIATLAAMEDFAVFKFGVEDIVRSGFVQRYYEVKERLAS